MGLALSTTVHYRDRYNVMIFQFDTTMVVLMTLILVFHADFYTLINRDKLEKIQMKYIMILHRYLRFLNKIFRE